MPTAGTTSRITTALITVIGSVLTALITTYGTLHSKKGDLETENSQLERSQVQAGKLTAEIQHSRQNLAIPLVWKEADLGPGWTPSEHDAPVSYAIDAQGFVHLRGIAKGQGSEANPMFILPDGYRPPLPIEGATTCGGTLPGAVAVQISTAGRIYFANCQSWASVDGVVFSTIK
jgi:hypothetical protein